MPMSNAPALPPRPAGSTENNATLQNTYSPYRSTYANQTSPYSYGVYGSSYGNYGGMSGGYGSYGSYGGGLGNYGGYSGFSGYGGYGPYPLAMPPWITGDGPDFAALFGGRLRQSDAGRAEFIQGIAGRSRYCSAGVGDGAGGGAQAL